MIFGDSASGQRPENQLDGFWRRAQLKSSAPLRFELQRTAPGCAWPREPPPRMPAMKTYSLFHLADDVLLHGLKSLLARDRTTNAELLAHIAEVDERRLYLPAAHVDQRARRDEVIPWLRRLGLRVDEAKRGAAMCDGMPDASLEDRVRFALSGLARERFRRATPLAGATG